AAVGGEQFQVDVSDGVPLLTPEGVPYFTVTSTFPGVFTSAQTTCDSNNANCTILFTLANPAVPADDTILIRDARGCTAEITLTVTPATVKTLTLTANPTSIAGAGGGNVTIAALALDSNNKPLANVTLLFTTSAGTLTPTTATTDATGKATATL